jgi:hypothetical protein
VFAVYKFTVGSPGVESGNSFTEREAHHMATVQDGRNDLIIDFLGFMEPQFPDIAATVRLNPLSGGELRDRHVIVTVTAGGKTYAEHDPNLLWALHHIAGRMGARWKDDVFACGIGEPGASAVRPSDV